MNVHILIHGLALCGVGAPRDWGDADAKWVSVFDTALATCTRCRRELVARNMSTNTRTPITREMAREPCREDIK